MKSLNYPVFKLIDDNQNVETRNAKIVVFAFVLDAFPAALKAIIRLRMA